MCDHPLGKSTIKIGVLGCKWESFKTQSSWKGVYQSVPPAILEVILDGIQDDRGEPRHLILEELQKIGSETINLVDVQSAQNKLFETDGNDATESDEDPDENKETVRFQYDGKILMNIVVEESKDHAISCKSNEDSRSFHVIDYMTIFKVRGNVVHEISKEDGLYCDIVERNKYKVAVTNNVGMDTNTGFKDFYEDLDDRTKEALAFCSSITPNNAEPQDQCLFNITHDSNGRNAGFDSSFATGRPNLDGSNRHIFFSIIGGTADVSHTAAFFIEGLYTKGPGNSFALPTHHPIMILRDPPGKCV